MGTLTLGTLRERLVQGAGSLRSLIALGALCVVASAGTSCSLDPVHDGQVKALGAEDANIPTGAYHRSGQPCTVCHGGEGPAKNVFSLAGTVFYQAFDPANPHVPVPVDGAYVRIIDADKANHCFVTNCKGNFFARPEVFGAKGLKFPFLVSVQKVNGSGGQPVAMVGHIARESSCAACHKDPPFFDSPGHIYVAQQPPSPLPVCPPPVEPSPPPQCPEGPN
jgi:hypothetical protein